MDKELFDKMLRAAILKDRINYTVGLISEMKEAFLRHSEEDLRRNACGLYAQQLRELGVEPLRYEHFETLLKQGVNAALSSAEDVLWQQRRYEIAKDMLPAIYVEDGQAKRADHSDLGFEYKSLQGSAKEAVRFADALIEELKRTNNERH